MKNFIKISAKDNQVIKLAASLQSSAKARKETELFVLEGLRICRDALENRIAFDKLIVSESAVEKYESDIQLFSENSSKCFIIPDALFKRISDTSSPQGIIAIGYIPENIDVVNRNGRYVALENIADPANLGAVARTAEALGISGIIVTAGGCDPFSPKTLRASMGTILRMPIFTVNDLNEFIQRNSLRSFACVVDKNAYSITNVDFRDGDVILIGNEANGLTDSAKSKASACVTIPMNGRAESLNVSAAAAIAMWEMMKGGSFV